MSGKKRKREENEYSDEVKDGTKGLPPSCKENLRETKRRRRADLEPDSVPAMRWHWRWRLVALVSSKATRNVFVDCSVVVLVGLAVAAVLPQFPVIGKASGELTCNVL